MSFMSKKPQDPLGGLSRRDFLRLTGITMGGTAAVAMTGCAPETAQAADPINEIEELYICPLDGRQFPTFDAIEAHFEECHPDRVVPEMATLHVNGEDRKVQLEPQWTLQETLQRMGFTSVKCMCDRGGCGSCSVLIDGEPALACSTLAIECANRDIETVEGIAADEKWAPLFDAFVNTDSMQCGYCTPGQVVVAKYAIETYGDPTDEQINDIMAQNICRCGTYPRHNLAIHEAVANMGGGK